MKRYTVHFGGSRTDFFLEGSFRALDGLSEPAQTVILTDEHIYKAHAPKFRSWNTIVLRPGEAYKVQPTVDAVIGRLIEIGADRQTTLVGVGGGVITDLAGHIASVYMRGLRIGLVPTTLLALVDASIGGKNGIDVGPYKNLVGTIRQPAFILHDLSLLRSLPENEWFNGMAEVIKHACIADKRLFGELETLRLRTIRSRRQVLSQLVERNVRIKSRIVRRDPLEKDLRRVLNFGHTLGHALETQYELHHGQAVAIGMQYACRLSGRLTGFREEGRVCTLLERFGLPIRADFDRHRVWQVMKMDKKRERSHIQYILLERIGKAVQRSVPLDQLESILHAIQ